MENSDRQKYIFKCWACCHTYEVLALKPYIDSDGVIHLWLPAPTCDCVGNAVRKHSDNLWTWTQ